MPIPPIRGQAYALKPTPVTTNPNTRVADGSNPASTNPNTRKANGTGPARSDTPEKTAKLKTARNDIDKVLGANLRLKLPPTSTKQTSTASLAAGSTHAVSDLGSSDTKPEASSQTTASKKSKRKSSNASNLSNPKDKKTKLSHNAFASLPLVEMKPVIKGNFPIPKANAYTEGIFRDINHPQKEENSRTFFEFCSELTEDKVFALLDGPKMNSSKVINSLHSEEDGTLPKVFIPQYSPDDFIEMNDKKPSNIDLSYGKYSEFVYGGDIASVNCFYLDYTSSHRGGVNSHVYPLQDIYSTLEMTPQTEISLSVTFSQRRGSASAEKNNHALFHEKNVFEASPQEEAQHQLKAIFASNGFKAIKGSHVSYGTPSPMSTYFFY